MRSVAWLIAALLRLLDLHEESLEFRRVGVGINHGWGHQVSQGLGSLAFVLGYAAETPMDGETDLMDLFSVNQHRLDSFSDHGLGDVRSTDAGDFHLLATLQTHLAGQLFRYFHKRLRNQLDVHGIVLGPIVIMLG